MYSVPGLQWCLAASGGRTLVYFRHLICVLSGTKVGFEVGSVALDGLALLPLSTCPGRIDNKPCTDECPYQKGQVLDTLDMPSVGDQTVLVFSYLQGFSIIS